ncbi:transglutaminase family protein [Caminibacter sp.]
MKFLKNLHYIDYLLIVSAIPVFFVLPFLMKIYVLILLIALVFRKTYIKTFYFIGILFLVFSFWGEFSGRINHFEIYMKLLSSLLFIAVLLQRMEGGVNFYMKISPVLFLLFSVVFFQNIYMLFYIFIEIFVFLFAYLNAEIENKKIALNYALKFYLFSIPIVVLLFLFFPRPHMKNVKFGLKAGAVSGFSEVLNSSPGKIISKNVKVAEYKFTEIPKSLYFRGAVLYKRVGKMWVKVYRGRDILISYKRKINYTIKQFPTLKRNIFALDLPLKSKNLILSPFYTLKTKKPLKNVFFDRFSSVQDYVLKAEILPKEAYEYNKNFNKFAQIEAKKFMKIKNRVKRLKAIEKFFINQKIIYTINPKKLDGLNIVDSLFQQKTGYCTHFASAFALFVRMAGIPSRLVVGYLGKKKNMLNNFLILKESDAHAWVEVYINRWIRVDPTSFAYKNEVRPLIKKPSKLVMWIDYVRFLIEEWVLNYDFAKQQKFFKWLEKNKIVFIAFFILFLFLVLMPVFRCDIECRLRKRLKKMGYEGNESIYRFLKEKNPRLNELYHKWKFYKVSKDELKELKRLVSKLK